MKRKNLEKAIILGLMVASVSVPVWAADEYFHGNGAPGALYGGIHKAETPDDDMIITNKGNSNTKGTYSEDASYNLTISGYDNIIINTYGEIDENNNLIGDAYGASDGIFTSKAEGQEVNITDFNKLKRLCHNKQLINSHFYRGVSELPYKLLFAVIYTHLEFRYEVSHTITSHHVHHFHQTRIPDGTLLDYMVQYRKPLFPQFFLYPKKFLPENNPHHKEFHLRPYIQNNANQ